MLVKFSTRYGQLIMQGDPAVTLVRLGGHSGSVPGAVLGADLPAFLDGVRRGLEVHGDELSPPPAAPDPAARDSDRDEPRERPIPLRSRAVPLLDMVQTAIKRNSDLMWEQA